jgi:hypothetical protein
MTTPLGYITLWELCQRMVAKVAIPEGFSEDTTTDLFHEACEKVVEEIVKMVRSGTIPLFLEDWRSTVRRIPGEDLSHLHDGLHEAVRHGRFPPAPKPGHGNMFTYHLERDPDLKKYCGGRPLIKEENVAFLFPQKIYDVPQSTGAQGRPTKSMHLLKDEYYRRGGEDPDTLLTWLSTTHPTAPRPGRKSLMNNIAIWSRNKKSGAI